MNKRYQVYLFTFLLCTVLQLSLYNPVFSQTDYLSNSSNLPVHPRLLLLKGEEENIRKNLSSNPAMAIIHQQILVECDKMISLKPVEHIKIGKRLLDKSREALRRLFYLSYAWRMTHDNKYLQRGEQELLTVSRFSDWNPSHFLDVAEMTMAVSIGYDWMYDGLPDSSRNIIKAAIINKGLKPSMDSANNWWLHSPINWNQVCNAGMIYGAIAVFEDQPQLSRVIINRSIHSVQLAMKDYGPDGAYAEGYGYWDYGTSFNVMMLGAIEKLFHQYFGLTDIPGFLKTPYYYENMTGPSGDGFNFSDSGLKSGLQPALYWFSKLLQDPSLLWNQHAILLNSKPKEYNQNRLLPALILWSGSDTGAVPPKELMWEGTGKTPVALMRSSWTDSNAVYIAVKGGSPSNSHAHMDAGSFIMEADGERWAMDFGSENYNNIETKGIDLWNMKQNSPRWEVFRYNNKAHNTLIFDDSLQRVNGMSLISHYSKTPQFMNAVIDLTDIYKGQVNSSNRGIAIVNQSYVVIRDEIIPKSASIKVRWNMLTAANVQIISNNKAILTKNGKQLILEVQEPSDIVLKTWSTVSSKSYESKNDGTIFIGFEKMLPADTLSNLSVVLIPGSVISKQPGKIKPLSQWPGNRFK